MFIHYENGYDGESTHFDFGEKTYDYLSYIMYFLLQYFKILAKHGKVFVCVCVCVCVGGCVCYMEQRNYNILIKSTFYGLTT
jgi:hypothetical protein